MSRYQNERRAQRYNIQAAQEASRRAVRRGDVGVNRAANRYFEALMKLAIRQAKAAVAARYGAYPPVYTRRVILRRLQ